MCFHSLYIRTGLIPMISLPQLCRNTLEDVNNLFNTILLSMCRCMTFMENRKVEKEKALNHHKQESIRKGCIGKLTERQLSHTQRRHFHNPVKHLRWILLQTWLIIFAKISILGADYKVENFSLS